MIPIKAYDYRSTRDGDFELIFTVDRGQKTAVSSIFNELSDNDVRPEKKRKIFELSVAPKKKKRSLDANAYAWVLIGQIADRAGISNIDVYREAISKMNVYEIMPVKEEALDRWIQIWEGRGKGWICESLGPSKLSGYVNVICHYGSSVYSSEEMARLIDYIVEEAKALNIETKTPDELEHLKAMWQEKVKQ